MDPDSEHIFVLYSNNLVFPENHLVKGVWPVKGK